MVDEDAVGEESGYSEWEETIWESSTLFQLGVEDWVRLHEVPGHRLWISPLAALSTVMEISAEDHLVNPHLAHVFVIPPTHDTNVDEAVVQGCRFEVLCPSGSPVLAPLYARTTNSCCRLSTLMLPTTEDHGRSREAPHRESY